MRQSCIKFTVGADCLCAAEKVTAGSLLAPIFCTVRGSVNGAFQQDLLRPPHAPSVARCHDGQASRRREAPSCPGCLICALNVGST